MNSRAMPSLPLQADDQVQHLRLHRDIQRRNRFVRDQELRVQRQSPGDADALTLATGKLVRIAMRGLCTEAHDIEQFIHALLTLCGYPT
jgi:tryptophanyl-tRNA synthetase